MPSFTITSENPNVVGEALREHFFDKSKGFGCYETFELNKDVNITTLPPEPVDPEYPQDGSWTKAWSVVHGKVVEMRYHWDGDGCLVFIIGDVALFNDDCKKDYNWEWIKTEELAYRYNGYWPEICR